MRIRRTIVTVASAERVWAFLVEPEKILKWCIPVKSFYHTSEQLSGVGTTFCFEERAAGKLLKLNFVVTEWVENERVAFKMTSGNCVKGYEQRYTIKATPGGARFTCAENIRLPYGILGKVAELFVRFGSEARVKNMLFKLKSMAEASGTVGTAG